MKFKVGDIVYCSYLNDYFKIVKIKSGLTYPLRGCHLVDFKKGKRDETSYWTIDGRYFESETITLKLCLKEKLLKLLKL